MAQMQRPTGKIRKTQAQIDAELAASKKAFEKYKATRPSRAKLAEIYTEQQSRLRRSKTVAPKPAVKRPSAKPVPLAPAPKRPAPTSTVRRAPAGPKTNKPAMTAKPKKIEKMTPQDAAMKKILEERYGKIYG